MKAAVLTEYGQFQWKDVSDPDIREDQVLVQVGYASICGTDLHVFGGNFRERTSLPLILGHEFAGTVMEVGAAVTSVQTGDRVAVDPIIWCGECVPCQNEHFPSCENLKLLGIDLDGGFGQYVAADANKVYTVGESISDRHAALVEVFSIGFHAVNRARVKDGDSIAIWGVGRVGQCIAQAARTKTDATIFVIDVLDNRVELASQLNENVIPIYAAQQNPIEVIRDKTDGHCVDIAFEAVGHARPTDFVANPIQGAVSSIRSGGTVCVLGLGDEPSEVLTKELVLKEGTLVTSRVTHGEFREVIEAMEAGSIQPEALISEELPVSQVQQAVTSLEEFPEKYLKILLKVHANR